MNLGEKIDTVIIEPLEQPQETPVEEPQEVPEPEPVLVP